MTSPVAEPLFIVHHARTGMVALNVITAALGADPRTAMVPIRFAKTREEVAALIDEAAYGGMRPVVGWSFYSTDFPGAAEAVVWVKDHTRDRDVLHIAGGVHATAEPLATLRAGFDLCAIGEGELTAIAIFEAIREGGDPRRVRGTAHLDASGKLVSHGPGDRTGLDAHPAFNLAHRKFNAIEITRGCVYACKFCQTPYVFKARFRHRSVANVRDHVAVLRREGLPYVRFVTPTALSYGSEDERVNLAAVEDLLAGVREAYGPEGRVYFGTFPSEVRPEHVTEAALSLIKRYANNDNLVIGAQSGSQRVLDATLRGHTVEDVVRAVRLTVAAGMQPNVDFLLGLPGETAEDRVASMRLAEELIAMGARIHSHAFMPLPGTPLRDATPAEIDPEAALWMARLESRGAMYGQWRQQVIAAADLARRRTAD
ncbi:MAG: TIGR04013 family B12-binding domain/radical SAM domain-containing protein [Minicystis sp.]